MRPASTFTFVALIWPLPFTSTFDPWIVTSFFAVTLALPPTSSVLPTLRTDVESVVTVVDPYSELFWPKPLDVLLLCVVVVFSRATMLTLLPAFRSALPPTLASVPASVMSLPAFADRLPPTVRPDFTCSTVVVVVTVLPRPPSGPRFEPTVEVFLFSIVSNVMLLPAFSDASVPAVMLAPRFVMSFFASSDSDPVDWIEPVWPTVVW